VEIFESKEFEKAKKRLEKYGFGFEDFEDGEELRFEFPWKRKSRK